MKNKITKSFLIFLATLLFFPSSAEVRNPFVGEVTNTGAPSRYELRKGAKTMKNVVASELPQVFYAPNAVEATDNLWGYCDGDFDKLSSIGYGKAGTYTVGFFVFSDFLLGKKTVAINLPVLTTNMRDVFVWGYGVDDDVSTLKYLFKQTVDSLNVGYNKITLDSPVAINNMWVGYTFTIPDISSDADKYPIAVSEGYDSDDCLYVGEGNLDDGNIHNYSNQGYGVCALQLFIDGKVYDNAATIKSIHTQNAAVKGNKVQVEVDIESNGKNGVNSIGYEIVVNGSKTSNTVSLIEPAPSGLNKTGKFIAEYTVPDEFGTFNCSINIVSVNGLPNEVKSTPSNFSVTTVSRIVPRQTVVEEYNTTRLGFCAKSLAGMHAMKNRFSDICNVIDWHGLDSKDPMYFRPYSLSFGYYPMCTIDRKIFTDTYWGSKKDGIINDLLEYNASIPTVDVNVEGVFEDIDNTEVKVKASTEFLTNCQGYTIVFVLTADGLSGTTSAWRQTNDYYGNQQAQAGVNYLEELPELAEFFQGGKYVSGYLEFNDVLIASSYAQGKTLVPAPVDQSVGAIAESEFTLTMPTKADLVNALKYNKIYVTALVIDEKGQIANSARARVLNSNEVIVPEYEDYSFIITSDSTSEVYYCSSSISNAVIPASIMVGGKTYNVTGIGKNVFSGHTKLTSVEFPSSISYIGENAFTGCSNLTKASFASVKSLCNISFASGANPLATTHHVYIGEEEVTDLVIPEGVTSIASNLFSGCTSLNSVVVGDDVTSIGSSAFNNCTGLTSIEIGKGVKSIGANAFKGCSNLAMSSFASLESLCNISFASGGNPLATTHRLYIEGEEVSDLVIPEGVTNIASSLFKGCTNLKTVVIGDDVASIGSSAFSGCSNLTSVVLGEGVENINSSAFSGCKKIKEMLCNAAVPPVCDSSIVDDIILLGTPLYVPNSSISAYENTDVWGDFRTIKKNAYALTYTINGEVYKSDTLLYKSAVTPEEEPTKEGHTFSGWSEIPETMPASDVEVTGTFSVNSYALTYKVDGEIYKQETIAYGTELVATEEPTKEGHTFSGWSEIPETMPAEDVEVTGTFSVNSYTLTYKVDGEVYKQETVAYGTELVAAEEPTKEGYTFSGWSEIPLTMPAEDVEITGTFSINMYKVSVTCNAGGTAELSEEDVAWGGSTTLTVTPDEGYEVIGVMVGSDEVTSQLVDGKYTISDVKSDITIFVMFSKSTGIDSVKSQAAEPSVITDMLGRKVQNPIKGNVYFVNGKKTMMK